MIRREFIQRASVLATTGALGLSDSLFAKQSQKSGIAFDLHCHPGVFFTKGTDRYAGDAMVSKTVKEMKGGGLSGAFFSTVSDAPILKIDQNGVSPTRAFEKGEAWKEYKRQLAFAKELLNSDNTRLATSVDDLKKSDKVAAFISCEGGDFIEGIELLDEVYADGVRSIQIVHYAPNQLGDLQTESSQHNGLSGLGKDVIRKMNLLGIVIDVAHASYETVKAVAAATDSPIMLSHSILKMEDDRPIGARAISEEHAKKVAETGGIIGAWPSGFSKSFDEFVDNTLRLVDVVGIDHVGLGTDMDANYKPVLSSYSQFPQWTDALRKKGLSREEVHKLAGGNALRVLEAIL